MKWQSTALAALGATMLLSLGAVAAEAPARADGAIAATSKASKTESRCDASATSRIRRKNDDCARSAAPTRTWTKQDLESTGQMDTGEALRRLDPRFH